MDQFVALIVAGGTGSRAGDGIPKQYRVLNGKSVLRQTVETFLNCPGCRDVKVVINGDHHDYYSQAMLGLTLGAPVIGGATRQESVSKGLGALPDMTDTSKVLIHDAARPFITQDVIADCVRKLDAAQAVTVAVPVSDTIRRANGNTLNDALDRDNLWSIQTPQGFHYGVIKQAHEELSGNFTDDSQMVSEMGIAVEIVEGSRRNIKLTTEDDFNMFPALKVTKTGMGYDVHAFGEDSTSIRIGGVDIPHSKKLLGHSDADVVLHAITDAIYGTISSGDIGSHFPPSNMEFKNMDSRIFLEKAVAELKAEGGAIIHIDTVVICEDPKIGPHRDKIRESIANICAIPLKSVSVKATTSEGLGFTGRREGIACQSIVTIEMNS